MPAMHLTSVDFPAPLSPTKATTSPGLMARSTSWRTCTGPKLLFSPRISRSGSVTVFPPAGGRTIRPSGHLVLGRCDRRLLDARGGARGLDALADLGGRERTGVDHVHHVGLRDDMRRQQDRLQVVTRRLRAGELLQRQSGGSRVLAGDQGDRELG